MDNQYPTEDHIVAYRRSQEVGKLFQRASAPDGNRKVRQRSCELSDSFMQQAAKREALQCDGVKRFKRAALGYFGSCKELELGALTSLLRDTGVATGITDAASISHVLNGVTIRYTFWKEIEIKKVGESYRISVYRIM